MSKGKGYSFENNKIVDVKAVEKPIDKKSITFADRLKKFGSKTGEIIKSIDENNKKKKELEIERLTAEAKKTKIVAKIERNKASIRKSKSIGNNKKQNNDFNLDLGFKF